MLVTRNASLSGGGWAQSLPAQAESDDWHRGIGWEGGTNGGGLESLDHFFHPIRKAVQASQLGSQFKQGHLGGGGGDGGRFAEVVHKAWGGEPHDTETTGGGGS
jgi:hypothetical protein